MRLERDQLNNISKMSNTLLNITSHYPCYTTNQIFQNEDILMKYIFKSLIIICLTTSGIATFLPFHCQGTAVSSFDTYRFLLIVICLNIIFVLFSKYLRSFILLSAAAVLSGIYVIYQDKGMRFNNIEIVISGIFLVFLISLLIVKTKWHIVLLLNCIYIFQLIQWIVIANVNFLSSFYPRKFF